MTGDHLRLAARFHRLRPANDARDATAAIVGIVGPALVLALTANGFTVRAQPGHSVYCVRESDKIVVCVFDVLAGLITGKVPHQEWARMCEEAGIATVDLGDPGAAAGKFASAPVAAL